MKKIVVIMMILAIQFGYLLAMDKDNDSENLKNVSMIVAAHIINNDQQILLGKLIQDDTWNIPWDYMKKKKNSTKARTQEVIHDLTGMNIHLEALKPCSEIIWTSDSESSDNDLPEYVFGYVVKKCSETPQLLYPDKIAEWRWFGKDTLPKNIAFPTSSKLLLKILDDVSRDGELRKKALILVCTNIINENKQVLLGKAVDNNLWTSFSSFMKKKDDGTIECVRRVTKELLGISVYDPHLYAVGHGMCGDESFVSESFLVTNFSGHPQNLHQEEFHDIRWFTKEMLPKKEEYQNNACSLEEIYTILKNIK